MKAWTPHRREGVVDGVADVIVCGTLSSWLNSFESGVRKLSRVFLARRNRRVVCPRAGATGRIEDAAHVAGDRREARIGIVECGSESVRRLIRGSGLPGRFQEDRRPPPRRRRLFSSDFDRSLNGLRSCRDLVSIMASDLSGSRCIQGEHQPAAGTSSDITRGKSLISRGIGPRGPLILPVLSFLTALKEIRGNAEHTNPETFPFETFGCFV